jgi:hypothetical protein
MIGNHYIPRCLSLEDGVEDLVSGCELRTGMQGSPLSEGREEHSWPPGWFVGMLASLMPNKANFELSQKLEDRSGSFC